MWVRKDTEGAQSAGWAHDPEGTNTEKSGTHRQIHPVSAGEHTPRAVPNVIVSRASFRNQHGPHDYMSRASPSKNAANLVAPPHKTPGVDDGTPTQLRAPQPRPIPAEQRRRNQQCPAVPTGFAGKVFGCDLMPVGSIKLSERPRTWGWVRSDFRMLPWISMVSARLMLHRHLPFDFELCGGQVCVCV